MEEYQLLEKELRDWTGCKEMVACASGTAALHLAMESLRLPQGAKVIVPDFAMVACARAVVAAGLTPVFVDCHRDDLLLDVGLLEKYLKSVCFAGHGQLPYAVLAVHTYGRRCHMEDIRRAVDPYSLLVVEDMAELHGPWPHPATYAACWSFYRNKVVAGEEGGAVGLQSTEKAALARCLRNMGFTSAHDFTHVPRGWNHRMSNTHAGLVRHSLRLFDLNWATRRVQEGWCDKLCLPNWKMPPRESPWVYDLRIPGLTTEGQGRLVRLLQEVEVAARHGFKPLSSQPEFRECERVPGAGPHSQALDASREVIYLPLTPGIPRELYEQAFEVLKREVD